MKNLNTLSLPKEETVALYLRAVGDNQWQQKLLFWLEDKKERTIYWIPYHPLTVPSFIEPLFSHPRLFTGHILTQFVWEHLYQPWELIGGDSRELASAILGCELTFALYRDFGHMPLTNVMQNIRLSSVQNGLFLKNSFKGVPAIICAAGPSLEMSLPVLKKAQKSALIFAGGSTLAPLAQANIPIHFAAAIDPDPPKERFLKQTYFETPLLYQSQLSHTLLSTHHGPKLCMGKSLSFDLEEWLGKEANLSFFDVGWTVSTFCVAAAAFFGCNPISFVGMDLCVYENSTYAPGVEGEDHRKNPIEMVDRKGRRVRSRPDFLMSKKWLENFAHTQKSISFINSSEGGLELFGIPYQPLKSSKMQRDLDGSVHCALSSLPLLQFSIEKIGKIEESIAKTKEMITHFLTALERNAPTYLEENALEGELFFQLHLAPLWKVWKYQLQSRNIIKEMKDEKLEKKMQELLFYQEMTKKFYGK